MNFSDCDISVVMVTHNGRALALAALASARSAVGSVSAEWIVVDCGSTDGTPDAVGAAYPDATVIRTRNVGFAAGNNRGLAKARGRYVLLLNPDTEILKGTLGDLVRAMDDRPEVGVASVVQRGADGSLLYSIRRFPSVTRQLAEALGATKLPGLSKLSEVVRAETSYLNESPADWLVGAFLIVRREICDDVGGFDEQFFLYSEETDWCHRIRAVGWDIRHLGVIEILHHGGDTLRPDLAAQLSLSKVLFAQKHFGIPRAIGFRAALVIRHSLRLVGMTLLLRMRADAKSRSAAELLALRVALGLSVPAPGANGQPQGHSK